jgi:hypothetical protein
MSKIFKGSFYYVDANNDFDTIDEFIDRLERDKYINHIDVFDKQESKEFEFDDDLKINKTDCNRKEFDKYFDNNKEKIIDISDEIKFNDEFND